MEGECTFAGKLLCILFIDMQENSDEYQERLQKLKRFLNTFSDIYFY